MWNLAWRNRKTGLGGLLVFAGALFASTLLGRFGAWTTTAGMAADAPPKSRPAAFGSPEATAFVKAHCVSCHGSTKPKGNFNIEPLLAEEKFKENAIAWRNVLERLEVRDMPPKETPAKRPGEEDYEGASVWLRREVAKLAGPSGRLSRRLNRLEYNSTIRDLLLIDFPAAEEFPPDLGLEGFDNVAEAQSLAPNLLEKYQQAAQEALKRAIVTGEKPGAIDIHYYPIARAQMEKTEPLKPSAVGLEKVLEKRQTAYEYGVSKGSVRVLCNGGKHREGKGAHGYETVIEHRQHPEKQGANMYFDWPPPLLGCRYKVKVKAYAEPTRDKMGKEVPPSGPCVMGFFANQRRFKSIGVDIGTEPKEYEFEFTATSSHHMELRINAQAEANWKDSQGVPRLVICETELIGPLFDSWPPPSHRAIFGPDGNWSTDEILTHFVERVFRRPAKPAEVAAYRALIDSEIEAGASRQEALIVGLQAIMVSPNFLFLVEESRPDRRLSDFELATRLSYFLWSSMPDAELLRVAKAGSLNRPEALKAQVARMLKDPKAEALVENFAVQWLGIRRANDLTPDSKVFPNWDNDLRRAIQEESEQFFRHIMRQNLSLLTFLDADFTFVNERLARHYGIPGVHGLEFRKVALKPEDGRGGLLTHALVLAVAAQPTRTSPVNRGKFVVDKLFNRPPPNPPADVPKLDEKASASTPKSLRQQLALHAQNAQCAGCHQKIDYWGLALEGYDGIGARRKVSTADETADLPDGRQVVGAAGLKQELLRRKADFLRGLAEKMLLYSLGRTLSLEDKEQVPAIQDHVAASGYKFQSLIEAIVLTDAFRKR